MGSFLWLAAWVALFRLIVAAARRGSGWLQHGLRTRPPAPQSGDAWLAEMKQAHDLAGEGHHEAAARSLRAALGVAGQGPDATTRTARTLAQLVGVELQLGRLVDARGHMTEMEALIASGAIPLVSHFGSDLHEFRAALLRLDEQPAAAETHLRAAIRIEERLGGPTNPALRTAVGELAELYRRRHHYAAAVAMLERLLRLEYPTADETARARREARLDLGSLELIRDNRAAAAAHFGRVIEELDVPQPQEWRRLSNALHGLAEVQIRAARFADAEELLERALKLRRDHDPTQRAGLLPLLDARARICAATGRLPEAESLRHDILTLTQGTFGRESPRLADPLEELADLKVRQQMPDLAVPLIEQSARLLWQSGGPDQPALAQVLDKQAALLRNAGYGLQAEATHATVRDIGKRLARRWAQN